MIGLFLKNGHLNKSRDLSSTTFLQWRSIDKIDNTKKNVHIFVIIFSYKKILFYAEIIKKR